MKKVLFAVLLFVTSFGFTGRVNAFVKNACIYEGINDDGSTFQVSARFYETNEKNAGVYIQPLNDVNIFGQKNGMNDLWAYLDDWIIRSGIKIKSSDSHNNEWVKPSDIDGYCFPYLYWKVNVGKDDWYVGYTSQKINDIGNNTAALKLVGPYSKTSSNSILKELECTYIQPAGSYSSMPAMITYRLTPSSNGYRYSVLGQSGTSGLLEYWYDGEVNEKFNAFASIGSSTEVKDLLNTRVFWYSSNGSWACPSMIEVGYDSNLTTPIWSSYVHFNNNIVIGFPTSELDGEIEPQVFSQLQQLMLDIDKAEHRASYPLAKGASHIEYEVAQDKTGQVCAYGLAENMKEDLNNWYYTLQEVNSNVNGKYYQAGVNDKYRNMELPIPSKNNIKVAFNKTMTSCDGTPEIYTNCLKNSTNCIISDKKSDFNGLSYDTLVQNVVINKTDAETMQTAMGKSTGFKFKRLSCQLSKRLSKVAGGSNLNNSNILKLKFYEYDGSSEEIYSLYQLATDSSICSDWGVSENYICNDDYCKSNLVYDTERKIREIASYCNETYDGLTNMRLKDSGYKARITECTQFDKVYSSLVAEGIISDFASGCNIVSNDAREIINDILNIIKIAGPLIAIGLGMLDFAKAVVSGDADKELKSAGQRFLKRIIAAIILILLPIILSFIMNIFLKNQPGYNSRSPFCGFGEATNSAQQSVNTGTVVKPSQNKPNNNGSVAVPY